MFALPARRTLHWVSATSVERIPDPSKFLWRFAQRSGSIRDHPGRGAWCSRLGEDEESMRKLLFALLLVLGLVAIAPAQANYIVQFDFANKDSFPGPGRVELSGRGSLTVKPNSTVRAPLNATLGVRFVNVNPNYSLKFNLQEIDVEGVSGNRDLTDALSAAREAQEKLNARQFNSMSAVKPDNTTVAKNDVLKSLFNVATVFGIVSDLSESASVDAVVDARTSLSDLYPGKSFEDKFRSDIATLEAIKDLQGDNGDKVDLSRVIERAREVLPTVRRFDDPNAFQSSFLAFFNDEKDIELVVTVEPRSRIIERSDKMPKTSFRIVFRATDRAAGLTSVGLAFDSIVDHAYSKQGDKFVLDVKDGGNFGVMSLYHVPFVSGGPTNTFGVSLGAGLQDSEPRLYAGLSFFTADRGRVVLTAGLAISRASRANVDVGSFTGDQVPMRSVTRSALFLGVTYRP